jgi:hypothetical protein
MFGEIHPRWLYDIVDWPMKAGGGYPFVSGIGSDIGEVTLIGMAAGWWHHINCIEKGCWRKGHADPGHGHPVCKRHQGKIEQKGSA